MKIHVCMLSIIVAPADRAISSKQLILVVRSNAQQLRIWFRKGDWRRNEAQSTASRSNRTVSDVEYLGSVDLLGDVQARRLFAGWTASECREPSGSDLATSI